MKKLVQDRVAKSTKNVEKVLQKKIKNEVFKKKSMKILLIRLLIK